MPLSFGDEQRPLDNTFWTKVLPLNPALHPNSAAIVAEIARQAAVTPPIINGSQSPPAWCPTVVVVPAGAPLITVQCANTTNHQADIGNGAIPIPAGVTVTPDSDAALIVLQPDAPNGGYMWELQGFRWVTPSVAACNSLSRMSGIMTRTQGHFVDWQFSGVDYKNPGHTYSTWEAAAWGIQGSGLPYAPGVITQRDIQRGQIDHALLLEVIDGAKGAHVWPASRSDLGNTATLSEQVLAEGMWLDLDRDFAIPTNLDPITTMVIEGVREHGLIITDRTLNCVAVRCTPECQPLISDAHLTGFPWGSLRCLQPGSDSVWHPTA